VLCIRLLHHRYSDAERQRILCELARVSRRFVIVSFYRSTLLHTVARHWRGSRGRLTTMTFPHLLELVQASGLQIQRVHSLLRFCHAQTFVVLTKTYSAGSRPRIDSQRDALPSPAAVAIQRTSPHH
jgi:hypothetical protein